MSNQYIHGANGKILATIKNTANQSYLVDFKSGKTVATYRNGRTQDLVKNQTVKGNQLVRFIKG
jgi:hypothetical protein